MGVLGTSDFSWFLSMWVWVCLWGAWYEAGVFGPFVVLFCRHDGFLGILLVVLFQCIVWGFFGSPWFVRGVHVGFVCCAGVLISPLSSLEVFSLEVVL